MVVDLVMFGLTTMSHGVATEEWTRYELMPNYSFHFAVFSSRGCGSRALPDSPSRVSCID